MRKQITKTKIILPLLGLATAALTFSHSVQATIVEFQTSQGNFQVNLYDESTPQTVDNFLNYINDGHYTNTVVHRVANPYVVQGGGYQFEGAWPLTRLETNSPVVNESIYSNVAGTIAMAKLGSDINSATDQWFFNLIDNSDNEYSLDLQNGGFTVFGEVIDDPNIDDDGMVVVNKIAQLNLCYYNDNLTSIPMVIDEGKTCAEIVAPGLENFVVIEAITIVDSSEATASDLYPLQTKYPDSDGDGVKDFYDAYPSDPTKSEEEISNDDGGSTTLLSLIMLLSLTIRKRFFNR